LGPRTYGTRAFGARVPVAPSLTRKSDLLTAEIAENAEEGRIW
jgi:hypothetical protein